MSDLKKYIHERKKRDRSFAEGYDEGYEQFKIGVVLKHARESAGLTQEELARRLKTKKTALPLGFVCPIETYFLCEIVPVKYTFFPV
jgi:hypothetical protein